MDSTRISQARLMATEKLFCVSPSQLALLCNGYDSWLRISRLWVQKQEFLFQNERTSKRTRKNPNVLNFLLFVLPVTETSHPVMFAKLTSKVKTTGCKSRSIEEKTLQFSPHSDKETPMVFSILDTINAKNVRLPEDRTFSRTLMPWNSKREVF